jgi:hypothetical protein
MPATIGTLVVLHQAQAAPLWALTSTAQALSDDVPSGTRCLLHRVQAGLSYAFWNHDCGLLEFSAAELPVVAGEPTVPAVVFGHLSPLRQAHASDRRLL